MKYTPKRDLPAFVRELKTFSPTALRDHILAQRNQAVTPESVTMWFKRNPEIYAQLKKEIIEEEKPKEVIAQTIFDNGVFEELESVKTWINEMEDRDLRREQIRQNVRALKRVCLGRFSKSKIDLVKGRVWCYKHPDRLTLDEAREIVRLMKAKDFDTSSIRLPLRNFLESKGIHVGKKISGAKGKGFGKLAKLYVKKSILNEILLWIRDLNYEAYVADLFMFKTGTRVSATLDARIENIKEEPHRRTIKKLIIRGKEFSFNEEVLTILSVLNIPYELKEEQIDGMYREIKVYDKGRKSKYPEGKPWDKHIPSDLWELMKPLIGDRKAGLIFNITAQELSNLNRSAFDKFIPELSKKIRMPNHFWRHMFFQHMLRATDWNYGASAQLGGSTVKSLEESYGMPPRAVVKRWGLKYLPRI